MVKLNKEKYIESYKLRNGSTKNASKSYTRYFEGSYKQENQNNRKKAFIKKQLEAQKEREAI